MLILSRLDPALSDMKLLPCFIEPLFGCPELLFSAFAVELQLFEKRTSHEFKVLTPAQNLFPRILDLRLKRTKLAQGVVGVEERVPHDLKLLTRTQNLSPCILDLLLKRTKLVRGACVGLLCNAVQPLHDCAMSSLDA